MENNNDYLLAIPAFTVGLITIPILFSFQDKYNEILLSIILVTILIEQVASEKKILVLIGLNIMGFICGLVTFGGILTAAIGIPIFVLWMLFINLCCKTSPFRKVKTWSINSYR